MDEKLQASLLSAVQCVTTTLGRAEGHARAGEAHEAMVFLAALEKDARGSAEALAHALGALDDLEETRRALGDAYHDDDDGGGEWAQDSGFCREPQTVPSPAASVRASACYRRKRGTGPAPITPS